MSPRGRAPKEAHVSAPAEKKVLLVDDDPTIREVLATLLQSHGYAVETAENGAQALELATSIPYDHIVTDLSMPVMDGLAFLRQIQDLELDASITVISAHSELENVSRAFKLGASDFIAKPFQSDDEILLTLQQAEDKKRLQKENVRLQKELEDHHVFANIVAKSRAMTAIFGTIAKIADYKTTVLITGESGTGKELIARAIHFNSVRKSRPLVDINCGGIPETLLESELFGYLKGAFTDAYRTKKGLFEEASGGTLFLDEIGDMPLLLQVKLLRALQEEEIRPLGDSRSVKVDVRIIAATAKNLRHEVEEKRFREDLFYRVNVLTIEVPPLRKRREDIPLLIDYFINKYNTRLSLNVLGVDNSCMERFLAYTWPGNVRELENVIERCMALTDKNIITSRHLPREVVQQSVFGLEDTGFEGLSIKRNRGIMEKRLIAEALAETGGNRTRAAALLEISIPALLYKIKEYRIETGVAGSGA